MTPQDVQTVVAAEALPSIEYIVAILVGASVFAYAITWAFKPLAKKVGKSHTWTLRVGSVLIGIGTGLGLAAALQVVWIWGLVFGAGGGAMTTIAVGLRKAAVKRLGADE